jgi:hypothetical protein
VDTHNPLLEPINMDTHNRSSTHKHGHPQQEQEQAQPRIHVYKNGVRFTSCFRFLLRP